MIVAYLDSSVLLKRVLDEEGASEARRMLRDIVAGEGLLVSSSLAWIEVSRAAHRLRARQVPLPDGFVDTALSGVAEHPMTSQVVSVARRLGSPQLRSLDAIHIASALLADVSVVVTGDQRMAVAAREADLEVTVPCSRP